jgi:16S rRNA (cytosine1402-N4)-methyltransferase
MSEEQFYHEPVLKDDVVKLLIGNLAGVYLDCTLGGGGHFRAIAGKLEKEATLIGIDRDPDAISWNRQNMVNKDLRIIIEQSRFSEFDEVLKKYEIAGVDGVLLDLGVSSWQIDSKDRGFSYMGEGALDMRMNKEEGMPADEYIASLSEAELCHILNEYGEVQNAARMARTLKTCEFPIKTSQDLRNCLSKEYGPNMKYKVLAKIFQALRIAINDELGELDRFLNKAIDYLKPQGRLAVMAYHSLEDRMVKEFLRSAENPCVCPKEFPMCVCGKKPLIKRITHKPVLASDQEIVSNPRSRSVRLRVAEKIDGVKSEE